MRNLNYEIAQAEQRVQCAQEAIANHSREWNGADRNTCFAKEDMKLKQKELNDAYATLYNLRAQQPVKSTGWRLAYVASAAS